MEGTSTTPLTKKLGVRPGDTVWLHHAPAAFALDAAADVTIRRRRVTPVDVVVAFYARTAVFAREVDTLSRAVFPSASLWVAWPKAASGVSTDVSDHAVRALALPLGLVDNKVCALDETWSALRLMWRANLRHVAPDDA